MKNYTAREIIKKAYGDSRNFITPHLISYGKLNSTTAYEFSWGGGMSRAKMFGVSVAKVVKGGKGQRSYELSKSFNTRTQANNYIKALKGTMGD